MNDLIQAVMQKYNVSEEQARKILAVSVVAAQRQQQAKNAGGQGEVRGLGSMLGGLLGGDNSQSGGGMDAGDMMNMLNGLMGSGGGGQQSGGGMMDMIGGLLGGGGGGSQSGGGMDAGDMLNMLNSMMGDGGGQQSGGGGMMDMIGGLLGGGGSGSQSGGGMDTGDMMNMLNGLLGGGGGQQSGGGNDEMMNMLMQMLGGGGGAPAQHSSPAQSPVQPWPNQQPAAQHDNIASQGGFGGKPGKKKEGADLESALNNMASAANHKEGKLGAKPGIKKDKGSTGKQSVEKENTSDNSGSNKKKKR